MLSIVLPVVRVVLFCWIVVVVSSFRPSAAPCLERCVSRPVRPLLSLRVPIHRRRSHRTRTSTEAQPDKNSDTSGTEEYRNIATQILSNFMNKKEMDSEVAPKERSPLADVDFSAPKAVNLPLAVLAEALHADLYESEWFVTGRVNPVYFDDAFRFQDPDVKLSGIEEYALGVRKIFDSKTARAEIISTVANPTKANTITCTWRLSGKVNIGPNGLSIKPYIVSTDFTVNPSNGLIIFQEDKFDLPQWDILLSALFPFLIGIVTAPPAPIPDRREPPPARPKLLAERTI